MPLQTLPETLLSVAFTGVLSCDYLRTDVPISGNQNIRQNIRYADLKTLFTNGDGDYKANLLYEDRFTVTAGGVRIIDLNGGLLNRWDQPLNFNAVHLLVVRNRNPFTNRAILGVGFKNEVLLIGPQGSRVIIEPIHDGMVVYPGLSSSSSEEGHLQLTALDGDIEADIIIVGSRYEVSSSSGI